MNKRPKLSFATCLTAIAALLLLAVGVFVLLSLSTIAPGVPAWRSALQLIANFFPSSGVTEPRTTSLLGLFSPFATSAFWVFGTTLLAVTIARVFELPIIYWADQKLINKIEIEKVEWEKQARPTRITSFMAWATPEVDPGEAQKPPEGIYETKPGEVFVTAWTEDWWWVTIYGWLVKRTSIPLIGVWLTLAGAGYLGSIIPLLGPAIYLLLLPPTALILGIRYLIVEWLRTNHIWFIFSQTFLNATFLAGFKELLFGGARIQYNVTAAAVPQEFAVRVLPWEFPSQLVPDSALPKTWLQKQLDHLVLIFLKNQRGVMSLAVWSFFRDAEDFLISFPRMSMVQQSMNQAVQIGAADVSYLQGVRAKANAILTPPTDRQERAKWSIKLAQKETQDFVVDATSHMTPPQTVNLVALKWRVLGGKPVNPLRVLFSRLGRRATVPHPAQPEPVPSVPLPFGDEFHAEEVPITPAATQEVDSPTETESRYRVRRTPE